MQKKLVFVFALVSCLMFSLTAFASEITDVRWGVDKPMCCVLWWTVINRQVIK